MTSPTYRLRDVRQLLAGFMEVQKQMYAEYSRYDADSHGHRFEVPVVILQGADDVLTITELAQEYYGRIEAPAKDLALIPDASHFAAFTRPDAFLTELVRRCGRNGSLARRA
jgi:pimeloyl-ACP methyl ester carboxylesterase